MAAQQQERLEIPAGGIADFAKTDEEIAALEAEEARRDFGDAGIANFSEVAGRMAGYGRFGDDSVAHVQTGEIIVPKELIDNNPRLKDQIFSELREAGIEDPEQYVVGSSANRINPDTGLLEFGFLSKLWKKLKKAVKKVVGFVLPIVGSIFGGPLGAALGSGIATLVQGGNIKDAFKSAALAGITSFAVGKIAPKLAGKGTDPASAAEGAVTEGASEAVADTVAGAGEVVDAGTMVSDSLFDTATRDALIPGSSDVITASGMFPEATGALSNVPASYNPLGQTGLGVLQEAYVSPAALAQPVLSVTPNVIAGQTGVGQTGVGVLSPENLPPGTSVVPGELTTATGEKLLSPVGGPEIIDKSTVYEPTFSERMLSKVTDPYDRLRSGESTLGDELFRGGESKAEVAARLESEALENANRAVANQQAAAAARGQRLSQAQLDTIFQKAYNAAPTQLPMLTRFGPTAALGVGALALSGGFETPEQEDIGIVERDEFGNPITGETLIRRDPSKYLVSELGYLRLNPETGQYEDVRDQGDDDDEEDDVFAMASNITRDNPYSQPIGAAQGGAMYPRRTGGIMPTEGIPNEDSVRALLMPGEFVMTTDAVRGAGNGSLNRGIDNMYSIMRNLERRGRVA